MNAVQLEHLEFGYQKNQPVLTDINIHVPQGSVYGFLGANGAGKTTTIRLIMDLMKPTSGSIKIFDQELKANRNLGLSKVGSLIESPSLYYHLSAKDNLRIWSKYFGVDKSRIDEVLDIVDLTKSKKQKTERFSTGMKQRLGIAIALLHDPDLLILDEPTNGLDPLGIIDFRNLILRLKSEGKTIMLSSHILSEVEKIVDQIGIIKDGKILFEGDMNDLQKIRQTNIDIKMKVSDYRTACKLLDLKDHSVENGKVHFTIEHENQIPEIIQTLIQNNIQVYELAQLSGDLEKMFLSVTSEN